MDEKSQPTLLRFGQFELDLEAEQLLNAGRIVRLQPQPFRLLSLLTSRAGKLVTREEIRAALWENDTFVDFEQGVNFAIKQVREGLSDQAERPVYIQTVPKRGYRFLAPVTSVRWRTAPEPAQPDPGLDKALWANIAELRLAEQRREKRQRLVTVTVVVIALVLVTLLLVKLRGTG